MAVIIERKRPTTKIIDPKEMIENHEMYWASQDINAPILKVNIPDDKSHKWKLVSCVQKAVRRGNLKVAYRAAYVCSKLDSNYLWRRIAVTLIEDIGLGNLNLVARGFTVCRFKTIRNNIGEENLLYTLLKEMCESNKDRTLCDLSVAAWYGFTRQQWKQYTTMSYGDLLHDYVTPVNTVEGMIHRHLSGCFLLRKNTEEFKGEKLSHSVTTFSFIYKDDTKFSGFINSFSPDVRHIMDCAEKMGLGGLDYALPILIPHHKNVIVQDDDNIQEHELIRGLLPESYDMHTTEGKRAYAYFSKCSEKFRNWYDGNKIKGSPVTLIGAAIFNVEGGLLSNREFYPVQEAIVNYSWDVEARSLGITRPQFNSLMKVVGADLDKLQYARKRVIED